MNHIDIGRALSLGENYSLLIMGVSNGDEDGGGVDGDGFQGNSPSRQGAGTEIYVPRTRVFDGGGATELFLENDRTSCRFQVKGYL